MQGNHLARVVGKWRGSRVSGAGAVNWRGYLFAGRGFLACNFFHLLPASMDTVVKKLLTFE